MPSQQYFFQQKKRNVAKKFFEKGFTTSSYILLALKEAGEGILNEIPDYYFGTVRKMLGIGKYKKPEFKKATVRANLCRLKKQGLIAEDPKKKVYYLTEKGEEFVAYIKDRYAILKKPWDDKFRIIIFDIPESKEYWRRWLRKELLLLQYRQLQKSVYIGKHPLSENFYKEITEAGITKHVFILTVGNIDREEEILELFERE